MLYFEDLEEGAVYWGAPCTVEKAEMVEYAQKNDPLPVHIDEAAAASTPFGGLIASGGFTITLWWRSDIPITQQLALVAGLEWRITAPRPVRAGDTLRTRFTIVNKRLASKRDRGVIKTKQELLNQHGEPVLICECVNLVATRSDAERETGP
jgi:acyl dehydratase